MQLRSHRSLLCYTYESMALHHISHAGFIADDLTVPPLPLRQFDPRRDLPVDSNYIATMPPNYPTFDAVVVLPSRSAFVFLQITISNNHDYPASGVENVKNTVGDAVWRSWTKFFVLCSKTEKAALTLVTSLEAKMKPPTDPKKLKTWKEPAAFLYESTILPLAITDDDVLGSLEGHVVRVDILFLLLFALLTASILRSAIVLHFRRTASREVKTWRGLSRVEEVDLAPVFLIRIPPPALDYHLGIPRYHTHYAEQRVDLLLLLHPRPLDPPPSAHPHLPVRSPRLQPPPPPSPLSPSATPTLPALALPSALSRSSSAAPVSIPMLGRRLERRQLRMKVVKRSL